jgi:crotonobetainyl-CoA:carnitine CoA-transferase CaiB-like acyl-CoA transferase
LDGIRVIESATLFNGDSVGMILGDLGADVIKVESPGRGDYLRDFLGQVTPHHSPAHMQVNKNKRSVTLDLRREEGRDVFWRLLATADAFVDGNAGDACDKLGIGYDEQRRRKPDIVYVQASGFGSVGTYAQIPTHGQMMNALAAATPHVRGADGYLHPENVGGFGGTTMGGEGTANAGVYAALHVASALVQQARTGQGAHVDISGADATISAAWIGATYALNDARIADRRSLPARASGEASARYNFYETADDKALLFCCIEPKFWANFCRAAGREDLLEATVSNGSPVDFGVGDDALRAQLADLIRTRPLADWVALAAQHDVALGPAPHDVGELLDDPHMKQRQIFFEGVHPHAGEFTYVGSPAVVGDQPYEVRHPAPLLGEHTDELLREIGLSAAEIAALHEAQVV